MVAVNPFESGRRNEPRIDVCFQGGQIDRRQYPPYGFGIVGRDLDKVAGAKISLEAFKLPAP